MKARPSPVKRTLTAPRSLQRVRHQPRCALSAPVLSARTRPHHNSTEGPWSEVMQAIHDCHAAVHAKGAPRIATDIRIGTRVDREIAPGTGNESKVQRVEQILAKAQA